MPLQEMDFGIDAFATPADVMSFIRDAEARIESFARAHELDPPTGFVVSDFAAAYSAVLGARRRMESGNQFCEWGCGFGVVAGLAAMVGFEGFGIELDHRLAEEAWQLIEDHELDVEIVCGSYVPLEDRELVESMLNAEAELGVQTHGVSAYDELGQDIEDFDVIYVFPWPGEEKPVERLFERRAAVGAILIVNNGLDGMRALQKVSHDPR